jgi:PAS domain S-box-containing protein
MDADQLIEDPSRDKSPGETNQALRDRITALELQLKIFKQAEDIGDIGHWQINLHTFEAWYSDNVYRLYGLEPFSIAVHADTFIPYIHIQDRDIVVKAFEQSFRNHIPIHLEFRITTPNDIEKHVNVVSSVTKNVIGESLLTGITQDITDLKNLELELRHTAEQYQLHYESFRHAEQIGLFGTLIINLNTRLTKYSDNFLRLFGLKHGEIVLAFDELAEYIHSDDRVFFRQIRNDLFEHNQPAEGEFRVVRPDGRIRQLRLKCKLLKNAEGDLLATGILNDITKSNQLEKQLTDTDVKLSIQNELFGQAERISNIGSWTWNLTTNKQQLSDNFYLLFGLKPQSKSQGFDHLFKYIHHADRQCLREVYDKLQQEPEDIDFRYRIVRVDGEVRHLRFRSRVITSAEGQHIIIGTTQDITTDILLNQQLNERIRFAEMMSENILDKIVVTNTSHNVIGWNSNAERAYGMKREQVMGRNVFELFPKIKNEVVIERYRKALSGEIVHLPEIELAYVKGYHEVTMLPIRDEEENVVAVMTLLHDISEQVDLRIELKNRLEFIEKLIESSAHRIVVLDRDLNFLYWNRKSAEFYQIPPEKVIGKNIAAVFPAYRQQEYYSNLKIALMGNAVHIPVSAEANLPSYSDEHMIPIKRNRKEVIAVLWIVHDLTNLVVIQEELRKQNKLLEAVLDAPNVGINVFKALRDKDNKVIDFEYLMASGKSVELVGIESLQGKRLFELFPARQKNLESYIQIVETGSTDVFEERLKIGSSEYWLLQSNARFGDGFINVWQDITEQKNAEAKFRKQSSLLRQASEMANLGSWELDLFSDVFTWSDQLFHIYGYAPQTFTPTLEFYLDTTEPQDRELVRASFEAAKSGTPFLLTHHIRSLDGRSLLVLLKGQPLTNPEGMVTVIIGTVQDNTEQKVLEEQLHKRNQTLRLQLHVNRQAESMRQVGNWQWNLDTNEMYWSEYIYQLFAKEPFSIKASYDNFLKLVHPDDRQQVKSILAEITLSRDAELPRFEFRTQIGSSIHYMRVSSRKISSKKGSLLIGSIMDITEDKQLQQQLAERMNFGEALFESSIDRIMAFDRELKILAWNKKCEHTYGYKKEEVIGKPYLEIFPEVKKNETVMAALQSALDGISIYVPVQKAHYAKGYVEGHYIPLHNSENEVYGMLHIVHDVTERIEAEQEMRRMNESLFQKNKQLESLNEELSSFAFIASHDLREPLRKVQVFADRILTREMNTLSSAGRDEFRRIQAAVRRMDTLIDDILGFSSVTASSKGFIDFSIAEVFENVKRDMNDEISQKKAIIESQPLPRITGNPSHFAHLFKNLLSNSLKFQPNGQRPKVKVSFREIGGGEIPGGYADPNSRYLEISIEDNGIGFEQQYENRIFQMFQRLHGMHEYEGTGMGLSICKKVMDIYQGFITAKSSPGNGAIFSCYFKLKSISSPPKL